MHFVAVELDLLVHSVAFAAAEDLEGRFTDTPRDRFWMALDVSAYSLVACARAAEPLMEAAGGGSVGGAVVDFVSSLLIGLVIGAVAANEGVESWRDENCDCC